jgi:heme iron utilization protein
MSLHPPLARRPQIATLILATPKGPHMPRPDPYLAPDDAARALAATLLDQARHAALAVTDPATYSPNISRIALARMKDGSILTLISQLSAHSIALLAQPACAILVGEPGAKGDPLTHPRLMIQAMASFVPRDEACHPTLRTAWLKRHPKSKLYIDFADFHLVRIAPVSVILNAGFGKAYRLLPADLSA